jgi:predicted RecA/RadA family phage recombinase
MRNFVQPGHLITVVAAAAIVAGSGVLVGSLFGIASTDAAEDDQVELAVDGVFDIAKTAAITFDPGDDVYWDNTAKKVTSVADDNYKIGVAIAAAVGADATARVRLNGVSVVVTPDAGGGA